MGYGEGKYGAAEKKYTCEPTNCSKLSTEVVLHRTVH